MKKQTNKKIIYNYDFFIQQFSNSFDNATGFSRSILFTKLIITYYELL
jgi:hypothetical protein